MVFEDYNEGLNWIAEGYKHKLFANDARKSAEVLPQDDSFTLLPSEKIDTYAGLRIKPPSPLDKHVARARNNRPGTAPPRFGGNKLERPWSSKSSQSYVSTDSRSSAGTPSPRPPNQPRIRSAGSAVERHRAAAKMRTTFTLVNKLYEDSNRRQNINLHPASPAPDYRYFDRHSRCFDYTHMHDILLHDRPQTACNQEPCSLHSRPVSAMSNYSRTSTTSEEQIDTMKQPKRYINYHRPRTAPPCMRSDVATLHRRSLGFQGHRPRFCNIVKSVPLYHRERRDMSPCTGDSGFDEFEYTTRDGRLVNRWRKDSGTSYEEEASDVIERAASQHVRNALDVWLSLGEDEFGNRVNFRPNYTLGLFSSIPEHPENKQDDLSTIPEVQESIQDELSKGAARSGIDGKPGTPTSIDDDWHRMDLDTSNKDDNDNDTDTIELMLPVVIVESKSGGKWHRLSIDIKLANAFPNDDSELENKDDNNQLCVPDDVDANEEDDIGDVNTPTQPPPTPEILTPKEPEKPPSPRARTSIIKKTLDRKPFNRHKRKEMEKPVEEPVKQPTPPPSPPPPPVVEEKKDSDIKVNLSEPSLPEFKETADKQKKKKLKPEKFALAKPEKLTVEDDTLLDSAITNQLKQFELMVSEMTSSEESPRKHNKPLKITGRLALSQQSSRFTLPMDMKELETMSAKEYVIQYCKITKRRQHLYDNVYRQAVGTVSKPLPYKELEKTLRTVLVDTLNHEYFKYICDLLEIKEGEDINSPLFSKMAALAERLLYPEYVTKETEDHKDYQKELIEVADFSALEWKLHGLCVRPEIQKLLKSLC